MSDPTAPEQNLGLPRILCLHGGGVNATVFRMQCRRLISGPLSPYFRLVFVDAPFPCPPHPAILQVYGEFGPFFRWLRYEEHHEAVDARVVAAQVISQCRAAMDADPGTGEWVAALGFSQGAKIAASLLWAQERLEPAQQPLPGVTFRFGVLLAGSPPVVLLDPTGSLPEPRYVSSPAELSLGPADTPLDSDGDHAISIPTVHVHGLQDPGIERHRRLLKLYCKPGSTLLVEWDGDHRVPVKTWDVELVASKIFELARRTGVM